MPRLAFLLLLLAPAADAAEPFRAGFAERDITPEIGSEAPGGYGKAYHRSIHDPCKVRAAVFDDGAAKVALVGVDALFVHRETVEAVRAKVAERTGIPASAILIGASHSHSSGPMCGTLPGSYDHAPELVRKLAYDASILVDMKYLRRVEAQMVDAICAAHDGRAAATAGVGRGREPTVAFNRRFLMRSGGTVTHPGLGNPDIVEPAGPTDPEVGVVGVFGPKGELLGCVVNFVCHATTSPGGISANYVYYLEKVIQGYYGKDAVVVFLAGTSGDVTQVDNRSPYKAPPGDKQAQIVGGRVGAEALKVLVGMEPGRLAPLAHRTTTLTFPKRVPDPERVKKSLETVQKGRKVAGDTDWLFAKEIVMLDAQLAKQPTADAEVQAVQVGPAVFLSSPAEYFCAFGLEQKAKSGFPFTFPVSLANGCVGYVPTAEAFGPAGGGYETRLTAYSNLDIGAGAKITEAAVTLARQLTPGAVPAPPKAPPFGGKAWSYGDNKPELR